MFSKLLWIPALLCLVAATGLAQMGVFPSPAGGPCTVSGSQTSGTVLTATDPVNCIWQTPSGAGTAVPPIVFSVSNVSSASYSEATHGQGTTPSVSLYSVSATTYTITGCTNASPIVCTVSSTAGLSQGNVLYVTGVGGNTAANMIWQLGTVTGTTFALSGSTGNGAYVSGGTAALAQQQYASNTYTDPAGDVFLTFNPNFTGLVVIGSGGGSAFQGVSSDVNGDLTARSLSAKGPYSGALIQQSRVTNATTTFGPPDDLASGGMLQPPAMSGGAYVAATVGSDLSGATAPSNVIGINGVGLCAGFAPTTLQLLQYTTASSPNPCWQAYSQIPSVLYATANSSDQVSGANETSTGLASGTYTSGITATGTTGQTCVLTGFNDSLTKAIATVALTGTNTIAGSTALVIIAAGTGASGAPTSATATSGTASCSGTATVSTVLGDNAQAFATSYALPANTIGAGSVIEIDLGVGFASTNVATNFNLWLGNTLIYSPGSVATAAISGTKSGTFRCLITGTTTPGAAVSIEVNCGGTGVQASPWSYWTNAVQSSALGSGILPFPLAATNGSQTISATIQYAATTAGNTSNLYSMTVTQLK
jgi:hypothetical protein